MPTIGPLKLKVQLLCADALAMGPGKADLIEAIDRAGSISGAGRELGMSYRRAWMLVAEMNRCWRERLVDAQSGGGDRSGARLTDHGRQVLAAYRRLEAGLASAAAGEDLAMLNALLLDQPRADPEPH
jgi:molybdate transport system regulatory protein